MIGKIQRVKLRDVWRHEAFDFTTWLEKNIDVLNEALSLSLQNVEREQDAGTFSVDLVAQDETGNFVVIENQLEKSNHDHLGKILTYLTAIEARAAIWIVAEPRPEHIRAIGWLNESTSANFYLVKVEGIQIGDSPPAPLLTLITGPSPEAKVIGQTKKERTEREQKLKEFWGELLERAKGRTGLHSNVSPNSTNFLSASAGKSGISFGYVITKTSGHIRLWILSPMHAEKNRTMFDALAGHKAEIERAFGGPLEWDASENKESCQIRTQVADMGLDSRDQWPEIQEAMIKAMVRFENALRPHLKKL